MTRNITELFLEIEITNDSIKKYIGKPIIYHHIENEYSYLISAILEDVSDDQIFIEKPSILMDKDGNTDFYDEKDSDFEGWIIEGDDFTKNSGNPPLLIKYIQSFYVSKENITLEQMQNIFLDYLKQDSV